MGLQRISVRDAVFELRNPTAEIDMFEVNSSAWPQRRKASFIADVHPQPRHDKLSIRGDMAVLVTNPYVP